MTARPIFYDTETTGIKTNGDRIVEIAAFDPVQDRTFCELVNPGMPIPAGASAVHNISDEMVAEASDWSEVGQRFEEFCAGDTILIAHNNDAFDVHFLRAEYTRFSMPMPEWRFVDSLKWARKYRKDLPRHALQFLREMYGFPENNAHRALDDVIVLHQVFQAMTDDLPIETVFELLNSQSSADGSEDLTEMPFGKHKGEPLEKVPKHYIKWLSGDGAFDKPENQPLRNAFKKRGLLPS